MSTPKFLTLLATLLYIDSDMNRINGRIEDASAIFMVAFIFAFIAFIWHVCNDNGVKP